MTTLEIPKVAYTRKDYNSEKNEIAINLNDNLWLDQLINDYQRSHRRILPQIIVNSPTGSSACFAYPKMDKWEIVYEGKNCNLRLGWKS